LHRVLPYQYYLRILDEVKHNAENLNIKRKRGVGNAIFALDHLLKPLYLNDWDLISPTEKQTRRDRLHWQKRIGKRLLTIASCIGLGILLLINQEALGCIKVIPNQTNVIS
jgi:hypothetical protein